MTDNARAFLVAIAGDEDFANDFLHAIDGAEGLRQAQAMVDFATMRGYELDFDDLVSVADEESLEFLDARDGEDDDALAAKLRDALA